MNEKFDKNHSNDTKISMETTRWYMEYVRLSYQGVLL